MSPEKPMTKIRNQIASIPYSIKVLKSLIQEDCGSHSVHREKKRQPQALLELTPVAL